MRETRAEEKLMGAVRGFGFKFSGKKVLDIGSSTGGFTDVALKGGATKVVAVEKGTHRRILREKARQRATRPLTKPLQREQDLYVHAFFLLFLFLLL